MAEKIDPQKPRREAVDPASAGSGGFCWCDMCGYVATLTDRMVDEWDHDHDDPQAAYHMCDLCEEQGMDSILQHGRHLPEHIIEDDPMREHSQNDQVSQNRGAKGVASE